MMATTIMISTRVKPDFRVVLIFILSCFFPFRGVDLATGRLLLFHCGPHIARCNHGRLKAKWVPITFNRETESGAYRKREKKRSIWDTGSNFLRKI
jgi:hypothetical protein